MVILVGHIDFHDGELWVVRLVHPFVAEVFGKFIHPFKATYDEAFEVELVGNTQVQWHVKRVVVRDEWSSCGATRDGLQNWRFHLHVSGIVKNAAHGAHDSISLAENLLNTRVHNEVNVALTVTNFRVGELIVYVSIGIFLYNRKRAQALGKHDQFLHVQAHFACLRGEHVAFYTDKITDV